MGRKAKRAERLRFNHRTLGPAPVLATICPVEVSLSRTLNLLLWELLLTGKQEDKKRGFSTLTTSSFCKSTCGFDFLNIEQPVSWFLVNLSWKPAWNWQVIYHTERWSNLCCKCMPMQSRSYLNHHDVYHLWYTTSLQWYMEESLKYLK